jgi:hypothetical protein
MGVYIRVDEHWQPWANTVAYYEFEQNLNDSSWNGNTATGTGIGYTLVDWQYVVTNTTSTWYINLPNWLGTNIWSGDFTLSFWVYPVTPWGTSDWVLLFWVSSSTTPYYWPNIYFDYYWNKRVTFRLSKENSDRLDLLDIDDSLIWAWHHFVMTRNSGVVSCYIDTTLKWTFNSSVTVPSSTETNVLFARWTDAQAWYNTWAKMDKAILESVWWTAEEVLDYYNYTKSNYWIS